jgi:hypothetical protein
VSRDAAAFLIALALALAFAPQDRGGAKRQGQQLDPCCNADRPATIRFLCARRADHNTRVCDKRVCDKPVCDKPVRDKPVCDKRVCDKRGCDKPVCDKRV